MKSFIKAIFAILSFAVASCAAVAESPDEGVPLAVMGAPKSAPSAVIPDNSPVVFKEVSGVWIGKDSGNVGEFYFRDIKISGATFTANFFFQSAARSACDVNTVIQGTYTNGTFEFFTQSTVCGKWEHKGTLNTSENTSDWKGGYKSGRFSGWYVVKNVSKAEH